jgi:flagellar biosynthesis protein FlhF
MEMKRFIGPDMRSALRMVREQLGPDAVILSNRRVAGGIEVTAGDSSDFGVTDEPAFVAAAVPATPAPPVQKARPVSASAFRSSVPDAAAADTELLAMRGDLRELRSMMEEQLGEIRIERLAWGPGVEARSWRLLTRSGLPNDIVSDLIAAIGPDMDWDSAHAALVSAIAAGIECADDVVALGGVIAAVGPTGAGKTTTLCKLAVRHVLSHGPEGVVLASFDAARLGGADMLRAVARLLEVPFIAAAEGEDIAALLARAGEPRLLLLDTPGMNRRRAGDAERLAKLASAGVRSLLVLPANAQRAWLESAAEDYRAARPAAAVVTKLDETVSLGEALGVLLRERLRLAYVTDGPEIPDDLRLGDAAELAVLALSATDASMTQTSRQRRPAFATTNPARMG